MSTFYKHFAFPLWKSVLVAIAFICASLSQATAQVRLVKDINTSVAPVDDGSGGNYYSAHASSGGRSFFVANRNELHTSDGTPDGTHLVREFVEIRELVVINGIAYFSAFSQEQGFELWRSDGSVSGTYMIKDIYPASGSSSPAHLTDFHGVLLFSANNKTNGRELWRSDGSSSGTWMVADVEGGTALSSNVSKLRVAGNKLFFVANDGERGHELFVTDGTPGGTMFVKDIYPGPEHGAPGELTAFGNSVLFSAAAPGLNRQLWKSDGTPDGTQLVKIIREGGRSAEIGKMVSVNGTAYFQATDGIHGIELWKSDGTASGTQLLKDITPGPGSDAQYAMEHIDYMTPALGRLFFTAITENDYHRVWTSDGTTAGTYPLVDHNVAIGWSTPGFREFNGHVYFISHSEIEGSSLFKTDGNTITLVKENITDTFWQDPLFAPLNDKLYFVFLDQYWSTDGTPGGTIPVKSYYLPGGSYPSAMTDLNGTLFFYTTDSYGSLWKSNGTSESTTKVLDAIGEISNPVTYNGKIVFQKSYNELHITDGTADGTLQLSHAARFADDFAEANGKLFFSAYGSNTGEELWMTDGTPEGTNLLKELAPGPDLHGSPDLLTAVNDLVLFRGATVTEGSELWRTDGTPEGTVMVKDINPGYASGYPINFATYNGKLYFQVNDGTHGYELWTSDGTLAGTYMVKDIATDDQTKSDMGSMLSTTQWLYFGATNPNNTQSFWRSNGSASGTSKLVDFQTDKPISFLGAAGPNVFFAVYFGGYSGDPKGYMELWRSNGTATGTKKLRKFSGSFTRDPSHAAVVGDVIYFPVAYNNTNKIFIWRSNGHYSGTYMIPFDGYVNEYAGKFVASGPYVYFNGITREFGSELYLIDESVSAAADIASVVEVVDETEPVMSYPNPFRSAFRVNVKGKNDEHFALNVLSTSGQAIGQTTLQCNTSHVLGESWRPGMYILQVRYNNRTITRKMVKLD